jgi:hypothetical protein
MLTQRAIDWRSGKPYQQQELRGKRSCPENLLSSCPKKSLKLKILPDDLRQTQ